MTLCPGLLLRFCRLERYYNLSLRHQVAHRLRKLRHLAKQGCHTRILPRWPRGAQGGQRSPVFDQ